jgi:hypothetical protein
MTRGLQGFLAGLLLTLAGCGSSPTPPADPDPLPDGPGPRVLFVGNSLTGLDVPALVRTLAAEGGRPLNVRVSVMPGANLEDHWEQGQAREMLAGAKWDFVVLQQGPSTRPDSQADLKRWATTWAEESRRHGAAPGLYMVWPVHTQANGFDLVSTSYRNAASAANARVFPVGEAWREALRRDPDVPLYDRDNLHATPAGNYLAALVLTHGLAGVRPQLAPDRVFLASGKVIELPAEQATLLREAAEAVVGPKE